MIPLFYPLQSFNDLIPINFVRLERKRFRKRGVSLLANAKLKKILLSYIHIYMEILLSLDVQVMLDFKMIIIPDQKIKPWIMI